MTSIFLLDSLKDVTEDAVCELYMPVYIKDDGEQEQFRVPEVFKMRLPDSTSARKKAPYIIHQVITGKEQQEQGKQSSSRVNIRSIFCVYCRDEQEGSLMLLNAIERVRQAFLKKPIIGGCFELDKKAGVEFLIYPDDTAPFYSGEMSSVWLLPEVQDERGSDFLHSDVWSEEQL